MANIPFKLSRGAETNIPTELTDGHMYFCYDTGNLYIDCQDETGTVERIQLNAEWAEKVRYEESGTIISIDVSELATKTYVDNAENVWYGTCNTSASTTAKVVDTTNGDFQLKTGAVCFIKFAYDSTSSSCTLNIDGTGAKTLNGGGGSSSSNSGAPRSTRMWCVVYNGSQYYSVLPAAASTTKYGITRLASSGSSTSYAATASYVNTKLSKSGGTMTGMLTLDGDPTNALHAATKQYVDQKVSDKIGATIIKWSSEDSGKPVIAMTASCSMASWTTSQTFDELKNYVTLQVMYSDESSETILNGFTLEGDLTSTGTKTITVKYKGNSATFEIEVVE